MRRIREVLRLKLLCGLSHREIARALGVSVGAVSHYGQLAEQAGLGRPEVEAIDESQLEARLMPRAPPVGRRVLPDFTAIHQELKRKGRDAPPPLGGVRRGASGRDDLPLHPVLPALRRLGAHLRIPAKLNG